MIYQLPNGQVLYISIEEYLSLTDEELLLVIAYNSGNEISSHMNYYDKTISEPIIEELVDNITEDSEDFNKPTLNLKDIEGDLF